MDDISEKLSAILNDPQAMKEIASLASGLGVDTSGLHKEEEKPPAQNITRQSPDESAMLSGLVPMLSALKQDDDTVRLLEAMRPFLSEERREKLDKAKRLIKVMKLMPMLRDLPLFDL